jgi:hypothetical protein
MKQIYGSTTHFLRKKACIVVVIAANSFEDGCCMLKDDGNISILLNKFFFSVSVKTFWDQAEAKFRVKYNQPNQVW